MKKKLIILAGSLMALAICATTYFSANANSDVSLLMQNVEAVAQTETYWPAVATSGTCKKCGKNIEICYQVITDETCEITPHGC